MSVNYYIICQDCKSWADMDSFYICSYLQSESPDNWSQKKNAFMETDELDQICEKWSAWTGRAVGFVLAHQGHKIGIYSEHEIDRISHDDNDEIDDDDENLIPGFTENLKFKKHCLEPFVKKK